MEIIPGADPLVMDILRRQTARRHPEWFNVEFHPPASEKELHRIRMEIERERNVKQQQGRRGSQ